ncbi:hypothetical protein F383_02689 [Gossypium arboreum]|uniref:Uncharacterized protein n=1 Tax=Gossypium arboreum TaxID=29729 RepID=A0A0B0PBR9_GOSAR|nr:hypothetical protein F383_02689 [Gossypium arboreum]
MLAKYSYIFSLFTYKFIESCLLESLSLNYLYLELQNSKLRST